ncbi:MAG: PfkB family carbohydrate kinase [Chloroflexi bacterium]|nr:PfkB family carbohydrate kinase [Chloroflexota bacterium]
MSPYDVVGIGMANVDVLTVVPRLPKPDEVYRVVRTDLQGGGPVATALVALARLGATAGYLGAVAPDPWGQFILDDFDRYGVDTSLIARAEAGASGLSVILIEQATGSRAILYHPGHLPNLPLSDAWRAAIRGARVLHLDGDFLPLAIEAARVAREAGVLVSFDGGAGEPRPGIEALLELTDLLVVARKFASNTTGMDDPLQAGPALRRFGAAEVVITDGAAGCWLWEGEAFMHQPAFTVPVVDTTGAGDTFHGAYLYARLQGWPARRRLVFASATAALKCMQIGGRRGIPSLTEVIAFENTR